MRFESPWAAFFLLVLPMLFWQVRRQKAAAIRFSSVSGIPPSIRSLRQRLFCLPSLCRWLTLILLIVCLMRPQQGVEHTREVHQGIAIEMVLDRSPSMSAEMNYLGQSLSRLEVVKRVFMEFVLGNGKELKGRPNDLVGIVAFAGHAETICPLTLARDVFPGLLKTVEFVGSGTAIGDAIALAAARLKTAEDTLNRTRGSSGKQPYAIKSKVMVLLTDGGNNVGLRLPHAAAELAAQWGIKIYTIGIGGRSEASLPIPPVDEAALKAIAESTGGEFRMAEDGDGLRSICARIDRLERSETPAVRVRQYRERFQICAITALLLLAAEVFTRCTLFRTLP
jgi:Ca-activated chloride channel homolog